MKVIINANSIYDTLRACGSPSLQDEFFLEMLEKLSQGDEWKGKSRNVAGPHHVNESFLGTKLQLPAPLKEVRLYARLNGEEFDAGFNFWAEKEIPISEKFAHDYGKRWKSLSDVAGFIVDGRDSVVSVMEDRGIFIPRYIVGTGSYYGTSPQRLRTLDDFVTQMGILGSAATTFVDCAYGKNSPDIELNFSI